MTRELAKCACCTDFTKFFSIRRLKPLYIAMLVDVCGFVCVCTHKYRVFYTSTTILQCVCVVYVMVCMCVCVCVHVHVRLSTLLAGEPFLKCSIYMPHTSLIVRCVTRRMYLQCLLVKRFLNAVCILHPSLIVSCMV